MDLQGLRKGYAEVYDESDVEKLLYLDSDDIQRLKEAAEDDDFYLDVFLYRYHPERVQELTIAEDDKIVLTQLGLPRRMEWRLEFNLDMDEQLVRGDRYERWEPAPGDWRYRILGLNNAIHPICLDEETGGTVVVFEENEDEPRYLNANIRALVLSICAFDAFYQHRESQRCREELARIDPRAVEEGALWPRWLVEREEYERENEAYQERLLNYEPIFYEHPRLGEFEWDEFEELAWVLDTTQLKSFANCGWNYRHVTDHSNPVSNEAGERVRPPAGEVFHPLLNPPESQGTLSLDVSIQADEASPPTALQEAAIDDLIDNGDEIVKCVADAAAKRLRGSDHLECLKRTLGDDSPKLAELLKTRSGVLSLLVFRHIIISRREHQGRAIIGCDCDCAWDPEHGFGVQIAGREILQTGGGYTSWC